MYTFSNVNMDFSIPDILQAYIEDYVNIFLEEDVDLPFSISRYNFYILKPIQLEK
jgi:hypothetical protein